MEILYDLVVVFIWAAIALIAVGLLGILIAGVRSIAHGKVEMLSIGIVLVPVLLIVALGLIFGADPDFTAAQAWARAGIWTTIVMFVLAMIGLLYTGIRGAFA